jgi:hypothetical protein
MMIIVISCLVMGLFFGMLIMGITEKHPLDL